MSDRDDLDRAYKSAVANDGDVYTELAYIWGVDRPAAKLRALGLSYGKEGENAMTNETGALLKQRGSVHGEFEENARATWRIMEVLQRERNWPTMPEGKRHALYMIAHKMGRIAAGDHNEPDHWKDIEGYAKCVSDRIAEPVVPYEAGDVYGALAIAWGVPRDEARDRYLRIMKEVQAQQAARAAAETQQAEQLGSGEVKVDGEAWRSGLAAIAESVRPPAEETSAPGTPEDGGQHAEAEEAPDLENLLREQDLASGIGEDAPLRHEITPKSTRRHR